MTKQEEVVRRELELERREGAAEALDMHVSTLNSRMLKLGIKKEQSYSAGFR